MAIIKNVDHKCEHLPIEPTTTTTTHNQHPLNKKNIKIKYITGIQAM